MTDFRHTWRAALTSETSPATATQRLDGLIIAEYANRDSGVAYPAAKTVGRRAAVDERTVRRALDELAWIRRGRKKLVVVAFLASLVASGVTSALFVAAVALGWA